MKQKKIIVITCIILGLLLITYSIFLMVNNKPKATPPKERNDLKLLITKMKKSSYYVELVYYTNDKYAGANHVITNFNYKNEIEEYFNNPEDKSKSYSFIDYKNHKQYTMTKKDEYFKEKNNSKSHHNMFISLLKDYKAKKEAADVYKIEVSKDNIKKYLQDFNKHYNNSLIYDNNIAYDIKILTKNNKISNLMISENDNDKNIIYTFSKWNQIKDIKLPTNLFKEEKPPENSSVAENIEEPVQ